MRMVESIIQTKQEHILPLIWSFQKDKSDSYTITRKVTLTDTEGQAHSEENWMERNRRSDTESEDDSDSPVQNYTDVEIETSEEDASAQAVKELKEDIEEGNVMVLSAAERATSSGSTVTLTKGRTIYYPSYIGNYLTCLFTVNGKNCILPPVPESIPTEWKLCGTGIGQ